MPLSEHEQRLLDQIERALYAEDPKFASTVRGVRLRRSSRRHRIQGLVLLVVGIALLLIGVMIPFTIAGVPAVSVFGFLVMLFGGMLAVLTWGKVDEEPSAKEAKANQHNSLTQRMEERFRRRFDDK